MYCGDLAELLFLDLKPHFVAAACWSAVPSLSVYIYWLDHSAVRVTRYVTLDDVA